MTKAKNRPIIAVDIDDVLVPTNEVMRIFVNENFGTNHTKEDHTRPAPYKGFFEQVWNVSNEEAERRYSSFIHSEDYATMHPFEEAVEAIAYLEKHYDLVVISAREADQMEVTHQWLLKHFPNVFSDVRFISGWYHGRKISKGQVCKEIGASYLIDDHIDHCLDAEKAGVKALLFSEYGWSKNNPDADKLTRAKDWEAVKKFFDEQRV